MYFLAVLINIETWYLIRLCMYYLTNLSLKIITAVTATQKHLFVFNKKTVMHYVKATLSLFSTRSVKQPFRKEVGNFSLVQLKVVYQHWPGRTGKTTGNVENCLSLLPVTLIYYAHIKGVSQPVIHEYTILIERCVDHCVPCTYVGRRN